MLSTAQINANIVLCIQFGKHTHTRYMSFLVVVAINVHHQSFYSFHSSTSSLPRPYTSPPRSHLISLFMYVLFYVQILVCAYMHTIYNKK